MSRLNEHFRRGAEAALEFKDKQVDRIEMLGIAALRKAKLSPETSELLVDKVSAGISILALSTLAVGITYGAEQELEKGLTAVVEYVIPDQQQDPSVIDILGQEPEIYPLNPDYSFDTRNNGTDDHLTARDIQ